MLFDIKFRHILFECTSSDVDNDGADGMVLLNDWPVDNDVAAEELESMKTTHCAIPLPAYDSDNHLIHPSAYRRELQGALVKIHFTLSHCAFKNKDAFSADIHMICVLRAPHTVSSITKRHLPTALNVPLLLPPPPLFKARQRPCLRRPDFTDFWQ
ncbi:hypothetical protein OG21DRAFT_1490947 [Imleria badia]|nr:hypothetical protein OG21DRAFT_1490947 [Imleria badia]